MKEEEMLKQFSKTIDKEEARILETFSANHEYWSGYIQGLKKGLDLLINVVYASSEEDTTNLEDLRVTTKEFITTLSEIKILAQLYHFRADLSGKRDEANKRVDEVKDSTSRDEKNELIGIAFDLSYFINRVTARIEYLESIGASIDSILK